MNKKKVILSWSTGKDSAICLHYLKQREDVEIVGLMTTVTDDYKRVSMHSTREELLKLQSNATGLPLMIVRIPYPCSNQIYQSKMKDYIDTIEKEGITHIAFGDLYLEDVREYRIKNLEATNITPLFPLWKIPTPELASQIIDLGFEAIISCIDPRKLPSSSIGKKYNIEFVKELPENVDPCGENGEFHTVVYNGPIFDNPLEVSVGEIVERDGFLFADIAHS